MQFPYYLEIGSYRIHPHPFFEGLGYLLALTLAVWSKISMTKRFTPVELHNTIWVLAGAMVGGLLGAITLSLLDSGVVRSVSEGGSLPDIGKSVVGGLAGGWVGAEIAKRGLGVRNSTGDMWAIPICLGLAVGRIGCFLTGLSDHTYGVATTLLLGVDFGDGIPRHPTQLYEIAFLLALGGYLILQRSLLSPDGVQFRIFLLAYAVWRFCIDFLKPVPHPIFGLSAIQIVCAVGGLYLWCWLQRYKIKKAESARAVSQLQGADDHDK